MKKLTTYILFGLFCLNTTAVFAQTKKETVQEKILRLEVENKILKQQNAQLLNQIVELKSSPKTLSQQAITSQSRNISVKSQYKNREIQRLCESIPACKKWAEGMYKAQNIQVIKASVTGEENFSSSWMYPAGKRQYFSMSYITFPQERTVKFWKITWADGDSKSGGSRD